MSPNYRRNFLLKTARLFDLAAVSVTFNAALALSSGALSLSSLAQFLLLRIEITNILVFGAYLLLCSVIFSKCGVYLSHRLSLWSRVVSEMFVATSLITVSLIVLPFKISFVTKDFLLVFWLITFSVLLLSRLAGYQLLFYARSQGRNLRNLVIVGEGPEINALAGRIDRQMTLGYRVVRIITTKGT